MAHIMPAAPAPRITASNRSRRTSTRDRNARGVGIASPWLLRSRQRLDRSASGMHANSAPDARLRRARRRSRSRMSSPAPCPRIAVGGFMLESNSHAPVATRAEFEANVLLAGDALAGDLDAATPRSPGTITGFVRAMDASGPWTRLPTILAAVGASGSCEQGFLDWFLGELLARLRAAMPLDGVFLTLHGAADATGDVDPDGTILARVRALVGPGVPVVATLDLHANLGEAMVRNADVLVAYRTNPHVDMRARGEDCARHLRAMLGGLRLHSALEKLPLAPPSVTQGTAP
ncbi:MAG: M81 family metallopeptidase, partial [Alphaproteobacteria bacterium]|nr:M81 family metallopeptidase [Alphaproteobacteria bacterium]